MATFTVTTDSRIGDLSGKTGGDVYNVNGATLTIDQDSRVGKNQTTSTSLSNTTTSATLGGKIHVDASDVREIAYTGGAGVVPAYGTSITQGGASGELCAVYATIASTPVSAGGAVPASGFIKINNWNGTNFSAGALTGITATAVGVDVQGWLEIVQDQSATNTNSRLGGGFVTNESASVTPLLYQIGTTSGVAGQTFQTPTFGGTAATYCPGVLIEDGVGGYEFYPGVATSAGFNATNLGTDARSKFVESLATGIVRIGSNGTTNMGFVPPAGRKVYIPSVIFRQCTTGARTTNAVPNATLATRPDFTVSSGGVIKLYSCGGDWYPGFTGAYSVDMRYTNFFDQYYLYNLGSAFNVTYSFTGLSQAAAYIAFQENFNAFSGTLSNCKFYRSTAAASGFAMYSLASAGVIASNIEYGILAYTRNASGYSWSLNQCSGFSLSNLKQANGYTAFTTCPNCEISGIDHVDRIVGTTNATTPLYVVVTTSSCDQIKVHDITFGLNGTIANVHPYAGIVNCGYTSNSLFYNLGTYASPINSGSANQTGYIFVDAGSNSNVKIARQYLTTTRTGIYSSLNTSKELIFENLAGTTGSLVTASLNSNVRGVRAASNSVTGQASCYGTHWQSMFDSATTGRLWLAMNEPTNATTDEVETVSLGTGAGFTSAGQIAMPNLGDQVIWTMPYFALGYTAFTNTAATITGTNTGNFTYEYDIDTGAGFSGIYKTLSGANLSGETINATTGFKLKLRITTATANASNALTYVRISMTTTSTEQETLYPLVTSNATLSITGISAGTTIAVFKDGVEELDRQTILDTDYDYNYTWNSTDGDIIVDVLIWKADKQIVKLTGITLGDTSQSIPVSQVDDLIYTGTYTDRYSIDYMGKTITMNGGEVEYDVQGAYSKAKDHYLLTNNSQYEFPFTIVGGDDIVSGFSSIPYYTKLVSTWQVQPDAANHTLSVVNGVLLSTVSDPFLNSSGFTVRINYQQPVQAISVDTSGGGGGSLTAADVWTYTTRELSASGNAEITTPLESILFDVKNKTDNLPTDPADQSLVEAAISAIPSAPSAAANASAVRTELATELGRIDATVSSRLSSVGYTAPDNASLTTIKGKVKAIANEVL